MFKKRNSFLGIIVARKGSKSIKNKNLFKIMGKPLIEYTLDEAVKSRLLSDLVISTDDTKILKIAKKYQIKHFGKRSKNLSNDTAKTIDVIIDVIKKLKKNIPEFIVLLQPTSPLRKKKHIDESIRQMMKFRNKFDSLVSITRIDEPHPHKIKKIINGKVISFINGTNSEIPRQKLPKAYKLNGLIYICKTKILLNKKTLLYNTLPYVSKDSNIVNIDTLDDIEIFKMKLKENG